MTSAHEPAKAGGVDTEVNLVPFIDVMSCLVAFLLVTAAWTNLAQIRNTASGVGSEGPTEGPQAVRLSVLVARDSTWIGTTTGERHRLARTPTADDGLATLAAGYRASGLLPGPDVEIAADDGVSYQDIVTAMDTLIGAGFSRVGYLDPASLSVRFTR